MTCDFIRESSENPELGKTELQDQNNNLPQGDMPIKSKYRYNSFIAKVWGRKWLECWAKYKSNQTWFAIFSVFCGGIPFDFGIDMSFFIAC